MDRNIVNKLELFFHAFKLQRFKKGSIIIRDGEPFHHIYYIKSGFVRLYILSRNGREISLFIYSQGMYFPTLMGVSGGISADYFEAKSEVTAYAAPALEFTTFIQKSPDVLYDLSVRAGIMLRRFIRRMEIFTLETPYIRTVTALTHLYDIYKNPLRKAEPVIPISHHELSTWTHTTRETVSRQIEKLFHKQIVRCTKGKLKILAIENLRKEM
jgi:CRP/FNR family cyclic AMP-dependent transcriptional regulator